MKNLPKEWPEKKDDTCVDCEGTAINTYLKNGENCPSCNGTGLDFIEHTRNKAIDDCTNALPSVIESRDEEWRKHLNSILGTELYELHKKYFTPLPPKE